MDAEAQRAREQMKKLPFNEKVQNFWFYYKYHILAVAFAVIVFGTAVVQCIKQVDYDLNVLYFGTQQLTPQRIESFEKFLQDNSVDVTGNEKVDTLLSIYVGNINTAQQSGETMAMLVKLQAEIVSNVNPAFITDEAFKDFIVEGYPDSYEKIIDLSGVPVLREKFGIEEDEKLYWISMVEQKNQGNVLNSFDNAKGIERWLEENME